MLKPDGRTRAPRFRVFQVCPVTNQHFKKYTWAEWSRYSSDQRDPKPMPREKFDDFPTLAGYLMNAAPTFTGLRMGAERIVRSGSRRKGY
jgi:hypothetical protein